MKLHSYESFEVDEKDLFSLSAFISNHFEVTINVNAKRLYDFSKENNFSFFNSCVAAIYKAIEEIPEFKKYIVNEKGRQYSEINIVFPVLKDDNSTQDVCIESFNDFTSFKQWDNFLNHVKEHPDEYKMEFDEKSSEAPIAILSCIPWFYFTGFRNLVLKSDVFTTVIHWGKYENGKFPLAIEVNHTYIYAYHLGLFFDKLDEFMQNPNLIFGEK